NLLERVAEAAQRGRVRGDNLQGGGVQDQRPGGPLLEDSLVRGIGTGKRAAQAPQPPESHGRTRKDSDQCAKTNCQLVHTLPRRYDPSVEIGRASCRERVESSVGDV